MARATDGAKRGAWRTRLERFSAGRLTVTEFCQREGVSPASFYYWTRRLRPVNNDGGTAAVTSLAPSRQETPGKWIEVLVGDSIRVRMPADEPDAVAQLISRLQDKHDFGSTATTGRFQRIELNHTPVVPRR